LDALEGTIYFRALTEWELCGGSMVGACRRAFSVGNGMELAAVGLAIVYVGSSLCAFAALVGGLFALEVHPISGVLLTIGGMALLLYGVGGLCGTRPGKQ